MPTFPPNNNADEEGHNGIHPPEIEPEWILLFIGVVIGRKSRHIGDESE